MFDMNFYTPDKIEKLESNQIFVFGSNAKGSHSGGAALLAVKKFGAINGQAEGLQGQSYGFVTLTKSMKKVSLKTLKEQFDKLFEVATQNPNLEFLLTKVGCGIAGFKEKEVLKGFNYENVPVNVRMPKEWKPIKGYKAFNKGLICKDMKYKIGKTYDFKGKILICHYGYHFCVNGGDVYNYYSKDSIVCEIEAWGDIQEENNKCVTNKIKIVRQLSEEEKRFNSGHSNSGHRNSGDSNSGHKNSGNWNSGHSNSGNWNSGHSNSGYWNSGHSNSGYWNSGHRNSGNWNSGHSNSGYWNSGDWNSGYLNTDRPKVRIFNKETKRKIEDIVFPNFFYFELNQWIDESEMTEEEKIDYPSYKTTGGYLKKLDYKQAWRLSWDKATEDDRRKVLKLPNWNNALFLEISGIDVEFEFKHS